MVVDWVVPLVELLGIEMVDLMVALMVALKAVLLDEMTVVPRAVQMDFLTVDLSVALMELEMVVR